MKLKYSLDINPDNEMGDEFSFEIEGAFTDEDVALLTAALQASIEAQQAVEKVPVQFTVLKDGAQVFDERYEFTRTDAMDISMSAQKALVAIRDRASNG